MTSRDESLDLQRTITRTAFLLERLESHVSRIEEAASTQTDQLQRIEERLARVETLATDLPVIKAAVIDQTEQLTTHDERLSKLETA